MAESTQKANRHRSPNYPSISLEEAIQKIRVIYDDHRKNPADREVFSKILGYKGLNGASAKVISSLSKYGLLEGSGTALRVSSIGEDLALHRPGDPEFAKAVHIAVGSPTFFKELFLEYPEGLPTSDHSIEAALRKRGFHPQAVAPAIQTYRDTLDYEAKVTTASEEPQPDADKESPQKDADGSTPPNAPAPPPGQVSYSIPIAPDSRTIVVSGPFPVSRAEWNQFQKVLAAFEPALISDVDRAPSTEHEYGI